MNAPDCPVERLAAYAEGGLSAPDREALEAHAADCPACRGILLALWRERRGALPANCWRWAAAAAVLLLAGGVLASLRHRDAAAPGPAPSPASSAWFPAGALGDPAQPRLHLLREARLLLEPGASVRAEGGDRRLSASEGAFWLESAGAEILVALPGAELRLSRGEVAVRVPRAALSAWGWILPDASASDAGVEVCVLSGEAILKRDGAGRPVTIAAGAMDPSEVRRLRQAEGRLLASIPARDLFAPAALGQGAPLVRSASEGTGPFHWVTVLGRRSPSAELGLSFPVGGKGYQWMTGLGAVPPSAGEWVELTWDGERLTGRVNGAAAFSAGPGEFGRFLVPAEPAWGLSAWDGTAEVASSRLGPEAAP